jgi:hypothetical protein
MKKIILFLFFLFPTILLGKNELSKDNSHENLVSYFNKRITKFKKETENDVLLKNVDFIVENDFVTLIFEIIDNDDFFTKINNTDDSEIKSMFYYKEKENLQPYDVKLITLLFKDKKGFKLLMKSDEREKIFTIFTYEEIKHLLNK